MKLRSLVIVALGRGRARQPIRIDGERTSGSSLTYKGAIPPAHDLGQRHFEGWSRGGVTNMAGRRVPCEQPRSELRKELIVQIVVAWRGYAALSLLSIRPARFEHAVNVACPVYDPDDVDSGWRCAVEDQVLLETLDADTANLSMWWSCRSPRPPMPGMLAILPKVASTAS